MAEVLGPLTGVTRGGPLVAYAENPLLSAAVFSFIHKLNVSPLPLQSADSPRVVNDFIL
jgi:hypothetical protein